VLINPEKGEHKFALPEGKWLPAFGPAGLVKERGEAAYWHYTAPPLSLSVLRLDI